MTTRILHVSDLHVGAHDAGRRDVEDAVRSLVAADPPELVIASGDLSHRNRAAQHAHAATFLRSLGRPLVVVPGNHDLPALPPARVAAPFARFLAEWPETEPTYRSENAVVCGLNSVRPWRYQRGAISRDQLARARRELADAPSSALRVVVLHHHLTTPPWRTGKRTVPARSAVLAAFAAAGAELVVGGHTHQGIVIERREFQHVPENDRLVVLSGAPGLGRPRPGRHAEASGVQLYEADETSLRVSTHAWTGRGFELVANRLFPRTPISATISSAVDAKSIATIPLFSGLSKSDRRQVARFADEIDVPAGKQLVEEGEFGYEFFVIATGSADVSKAGEHVNSLGPGDFFGEIALLETERRTATVVATSPMRLIVVTRRDFKHLARELPDVAERVHDAIRQRLAGG